MAGPLSRTLQAFSSHLLGFPPIHKAARRRDDLVEIGPCLPGSLCMPAGARDISPHGDGGGSVTARRGPALPPENPAFLAAPRARGDSTLVALDRTQERIMTEVPPNLRRFVL